VEEDHKEIARKLMTSIYVDNCVSSFDNYREYTEFRSAAVDLLAQAKMELRQWECSAVEDSGVGLQGDSGCGLESGSGVLQDIEESDSTTNVLGLRWDKRSDCLSVVLPSEVHPATITKRAILSCVAKTFDPMGFLAPATLQLKLLLQEAWGFKLGWDEEVPTSVKNEFEK
jgi:hypothetical protein